MKRIKHISSLEAKKDAQTKCQVKKRNAKAGYKVASDVSYKFIQNLVDYRVKSMIVMPMGLFKRTLVVSKMHYRTK
jgi:hypothetical protein